MSRSFPLRVAPHSCFFAPSFLLPVIGPLLFPPSFPFPGGFWGRFPATLCALVSVMSCFRGDHCQKHPFFAGDVPDFRTPLAVAPKTRERATRRPPSDAIVGYLTVWLRAILPPATRRHALQALLTGADVWHVCGKSLLREISSAENLSCGEYLLWEISPARRLFCVNGQIRSAMMLSATNQNDSSMRTRSPMTSRPLGRCSMG